MVRTLFLSLIFWSMMTTARAAEPEKAQSLNTASFHVCGVPLMLEVADEPEERQIGLMHRLKIEDGKGMLFSFSAPQELAFWMHNVPFDIDIGYFDSKGHLKNHLTMSGTSPLQRPDSLPRYSSEGLVQFAVEVPKGFFAKLGGKTKSCQLKPVPKAGR